MLSDIGTSTSVILDGKKLSLEIRESLKERVQKCENYGLRLPKLYIIQVGNNEASNIYVRHKTKVCDELRISWYLRRFPEDVEEFEIIKIIQDANEDLCIDGILVQLPLPDHLTKSKILNGISPSKDVDGMGPYNIGRLVLREPSIRCCTPYGIMTLLEHYNITVKGKHSVIVGTSNIVGRPMVLEMLLAGATTTSCHRFTENLEGHIKMADILVVAIGKQGVIKSEWIKHGAVVVDVGINKTENGKLCGDVDFETARKRAAYITPVPGGVGPMTVITLMKNLIQIYEHNLDC